MINEYVENIMRKGITHFAEKENTDKANVQILILFDEEVGIRYKKMIQGKPSEYVTFNQILNVKFDLMNREAICANFIGNTLHKFSQSLGCQMSSLYVVIYLVESEADNEQEKDVRLYLYKNTEAIKEIELEEILK